MQISLPLLVIAILVLDQIPSFGRDTSRIVAAYVFSQQFNERTERPVSLKYMQQSEEPIISRDTILDVDILTSISQRLSLLGTRNVVENYENLRMECCIVYADGTMDTLLVGHMYMQWHGAKYEIDAALLWLLCVGLPTEHQWAVAEEIKFLHDDD